LMGDSLFWQPATLSFLCCSLHYCVCVVLWQIKFSLSLSLSLSRLDYQSEFTIPTFHCRVKFVDPAASSKISLRPFPWTSVREYVLYVFFRFQKTWLFTFFKWPVKKRKKVVSKNI